MLALLTGLGIGGIAVALALQKPIEDLFGAVSIYSQQPVNTGDLCRYGDSIGRVVEIGLRTTRIRTLSNSLVNVPNAQLSTGIIENLTARTKIMYQPDLPLRYDTSRDQLQAVLTAIEEALKANPRVEDRTIRVRLREFSPNAIIVRIRRRVEDRKRAAIPGVFSIIDVEDRRRGFDLHTSDRPLVLEAGVHPVIGRQGGGFIDVGEGEAVGCT